MIKYRQAPQFAGNINFWPTYCIEVYGNLIGTFTPEQNNGTAGGSLILTVYIRTVTAAEVSVEASCTLRKLCFNYQICM